MINVLTQNKDETRKKKILVRLLQAIVVIFIITAISNLFIGSVSADDYSDFVSDFNSLNTSSNSFSQDLNDFIFSNSNFYNYGNTPITIITPGVGCDHKNWNYNNSGVSNSIIDFISRRNCNVYY